MSFGRRIVGAGLIVVGGLSVAEAAIDAEANQIPTGFDHVTAPQQENLSFTENASLAWEHKYNEAVLASIAIVGLGIVTVFAPEGRRQQGRRYNNGGSGDGGWLFGGDGGGDGCSGGDGGDGGCD